jgi:hypothetical protein
MASIIAAGTTSGTALNMTADTSGQLQLATGATPTTAVTIDTSQNVGIGTTSPGQKLHVNNSSLGSTIKITDSQSTVDGFYLQAYSKAAYIWNYDNSFMALATNNTERMRIDSSGNTLWNTSSAPVNYAMFRGKGVSCDFSFGPQNQSGQTSFAVWNASTVGVYLVSGNTSWTGTSDGTLKNVTSKVTDGLNKVISMNPVYYSWKESEDNKQHIGFIAQEMEKIEPTVVEQNGGLYGINYTELIPVLTAAIQEQQTIINDLKARIETLEGVKS